MENEEIKGLIERYNNNQCTPQERMMVEQWLLLYNEQETGLPSRKIEQIGKEIFRNLPQAGKSEKSNHYLRTVLAAAAALTLVAFAVFFYSKSPSLPSGTIFTKDILPGGNKAILTLGNGKTIDLSETKTGIVIDAKVLTYNDGTTITAARDNKQGIQILSTPKGGQYHVMLSDGTSVFLNADSRLTFPSSFVKDKQRNVSLQGEAYFEVAKDRKHPFVVSTANQKVMVLGTHFNINTYQPEATRTTLLEGSVKVTGKAIKNSVVLKPGQQAFLSENKIAVKQADLGLEMAWRNGKTEFRDADLKTVMDMLERWYDIKVIYPNKIPEGQFSGSVSRSRNISEILELLESTGEVHFKIEGRRIKIL